MFINTLKKQRKQEGLKENYPWLDPNDERKYMKDKEILDKYIDLETIVPNGEGKERSDGNVV